MTSSFTTIVPNPAEESIMTDVTKFNFIEQSNDFIQRLPNAAWIAIDEEMTGIMLPNTKRPVKGQSPTERYESLKKVSERYSIIQLGICLFEEAGTSTGPAGAETAKFHVRRYKFTLFPPADNSITREITFNPSSIHFLAQNNMDFNHMVKSGIAYVTKGNANALAEKFYAKQFAKLSEESNTKSPAETKNSRRRVELTRLEDKNFHARSMASLREWLDAAIPNPNNGEEGANFLLPPCNSFLRRALYESIPREYPNLILETLSSTQQIRILRLNPNEKKRRTDRLLREGWERLITEKVGIYRIFLALTKACSGQAPANQAEHVVLASSVDKAMKLFDDTPSSFTSQRKIPIVVHNGLQDLFFLMTHFDAPELPETWADCKSRLHNYFPVIYDTKCMALEYATRENPRGATHLQAVYEQTLTTNPQWNRVFVAHNNNSSEEGVPAPENPEQAHDAAYDAYMTGAAFYGLADAIHHQVGFPRVTPGSKFKLWNSDPSEDVYAWMFGRNKLHFHLSPYTIDFESPLSDPLGRGMSATSTFRVSDIEATVSTRDVVRCLTGLVDSHGGRVNFELIWVDDTTFIVGAMLPNCRDMARFEEHGKILLEALSETFHRNETVQNLQESLQQKLNLGDHNGKNTSKRSSLWNLWGVLGSKKKKRSDGHQEEGADGRTKKRRRIF